MQGMSLQKQKPFRSKKYTDWVKSLPSVVSGMPADDPHHIIGHGQGGTGTKASDLFTFPLTRLEHAVLHNDYRVWEEQHGSQWKHVAKTLELAQREGIIEVK